MNNELMPITVEAKVLAPVAKVWKCWVTPEDIMQWNAASDDWHTPSASVDLRVGGTFVSRMEARDGSMGFDFGGTYTEVETHALIVFQFGEGANLRQVRIEFVPHGDATVVRETFTPETTHPVEAQRSGWQSILNRFKSHVETQP